MSTDHGANKAPAYQWYPRDFASDEHVQLMTLEQEGAYRRLLDHQWMNGSVPADVARLARICKNTPLPDMERIWEGVAPCFVPVEGEDGRLQNRKLERIRAAAREYHERQAAAGRRGADARWGRRGPEDGEANGDAMATPLAERMANDSSASASAPASASAGSSSVSQSSSVGQRADALVSTPAVRQLLNSFSHPLDQEAAQRFLTECPASDRDGWAERLSGYLQGADFGRGTRPTPEQLATAIRDYNTTPGAAPNPIHFRAFVTRVMKEHRGADQQQGAREEITPGQATAGLLWTDRRRRADAAVRA